MNTETLRQYHNKYIRLAIKKIWELRKSNSCVSSYAYTMASGNHRGFFFHFFFEFCVIATVATIHKRREPNLATGQTIRRG